MKEGFQRFQASLVFGGGIRDTSTCGTTRLDRAREDGEGGNEKRVDWGILLVCLEENCF